MAGMKVMNVALSGVLNVVPPPLTLSGALLLGSRNFKTKWSQSTRSKAMSGCFFKKISYSPGRQSAALTRNLCNF